VPSPEEIGAAVAVVSDSDGAFSVGVFVTTNRTVAITSRAIKQNRPSHIVRIISRQRFQEVEILRLVRHRIKANRRLDPRLVHGFQIMRQDALVQPLKIRLQQRPVLS
jgi:hypothetical protein